MKTEALCEGGNATFEQSSIHPNSRCRCGGKVACFLRLISLDPVGIARITKADVITAEEKNCEIRRQLTGTSSCITSVNCEVSPKD
jgi:hypothetical protein